ncbi:hypothetical protein JMJ77_0008102 [Colletotrichum scovillei]|uniref:Uncharacterized protein n=2 Tax=Colletotrichum scovillei TaxID=1209932 RepID=A0A9P7RGC0_9PEZI|nr:hypothetical protein JMJ77_0008102 [Colletotrichum scovillei]KAG7075127.1 hypothetical protein JMJ76_0011589 [Colletotrichum scovillei]KAG7082124.1 hypothetical protein JMJ78_0004229 [Colletotrichum scovillei]
MGLPITTSASISVPEANSFGATVLQPQSDHNSNGRGGCPYLANAHNNGTPDTTHANITQQVTPAAPAPPLGILKKLENRTFTGRGFNTIFRPHSTTSPTVLHVTPVLKPPFIPDNILQLNITHETQVFAPGLGDVPNRGLMEQEDIELNGVPYTQTIHDITEAKTKPPVIHFEPGLWMHVPATTIPNLKTSLARMASIPHGTTINAQCFSEPSFSRGKPIIPKVDITPTRLDNGDQIHFPSQDVEDPATFRLPQDLHPFLQARTITKEMVKDPNSVLELANKGKDIIENTSYKITTKPEGTNLGGGTSNIGFLVGDGEQALELPRRANANATGMEAQYWISTVRTKIHLEPWKGPSEHQRCKHFSPLPLREGEEVPVFEVHFPIPQAKTVTVEYTQLQYTQNVALDFATLRWPHVTVGTLIQTSPIVLHASILNQKE